MGVVVCCVVLCGEAKVAAHQALVHKAKGGCVGWAVIALGVVVVVGLVCGVGVVCTANNNNKCGWFGGWHHGCCGGGVEQGTGHTGHQHNHTMCTPWLLWCGCGVW